MPAGAEVTVPAPAGVTVSVAVEGPVGGGTLPIPPAPPSLPRPQQRRAAERAAMSERWRGMGRPPLQRYAAAVGTRSPPLQPIGRAPARRQPTVKLDQPRRRASARNVRTPATVAGRS